MPRGRRPSLFDFRNDVAVRIQSAMDARGWTRKQLASGAHISISTVHYIMRAEHGIAAHLACDIAVALGVSLDWLLRGEEFAGEKWPLLTSPKSEGNEYNGGHSCGGTSPADAPGNGSDGETAGGTGTE